MEDLPQLAEALIGDTNRKNNCRVTGIDDAVLTQLRKYQWPGNVRELRNVLERAAILANEGAITSSQLPPGFGESAAMQRIAAGSDAGAVRLPVGTRIDEAEKALIISTLEHTNNNKTKAAEILGISLKTLFNKLKEYSSSERKA
jgi:DNA-binding NtrC family response regulator